MCVYVCLKSDQVCSSMRENGAKTSAQGKQRFIHARYVFNTVSFNEIQTSLWLSVH